MNIEKTIRDYLSEVLHMSLGTCADNKPWVCEVHFVYDEDLNIYFRSKKIRRHSEEIAQNQNVAGNVVKQHALDEKPRGVYFEGKAEILENVDEHHVVFRAFQERLKLGKEILEDAKKDDGHKFYKITVDTFYLFDAQESSLSRKYELRWKK